jgi:hypothetical protein
LEEVEQIRFKFFEGDGKHHGWSHALTIQQLREAKNKATYLERKYFYNYSYELQNGNITL